MSSKRMHSSNQPDMLSCLPDAILIVIISSLCFKDCLKTSVLSKRWRHLCHETTNLSFKEFEYVNSAVNYMPRWKARTSFLLYMLQWADRFQGRVLDSFEINITNPACVLEDVDHLIDFAISKNVKSLVLDFSDPAWIHCREVILPYTLVYQLPDSVYNSVTLESLKIHRCRFNTSRFVNLESLRSLSVGWVSLRNIEALLSKAPSLESLSLSYCWDDGDVIKIAAQIRELIITNCKITMAMLFDVPKIDIFKYSGEVKRLDFMELNPILKEVDLDFGEEDKYNKPSQHTILIASVLCGLLNDLRSAQTLTVCPYLLQTIPYCKDPFFFLRAVEAKHLVLRTTMRVREFMGIRMLLENCPNLETLTFFILPPSSNTGLTYGAIHAHTYWLQAVSCKCLKTKLKLVVVRNFGGGTTELDVLKYLIRYGRRNALERIDLYISNGLDENQSMLARSGAETLQKISRYVQVVVHNA